MYYKRTTFVLTLQGSPCIGEPLGEGLLPLAPEAGASGGGPVPQSCSGRRRRRHGGAGGVLVLSPDGVFARSVLLVRQLLRLLLLLRLVRQLRLELKT